MEWIKGVPKEYTECLCYEDGNQWTCIYNGKEWVQPKEDNLPTHWMLLPEPPKECDEHPIKRSSKKLIGKKGKAKIYPMYAPHIIIGTNKSILDV